MNASRCNVTTLSPELISDFFERIHDDALILVGDREQFVPVSAFGYSLGVYTNSISVWSFDKPCHSLCGCYPINMDNHWFGVLLDASGWSWPVQYIENSDTGLATVTVVNESLSFQWIQDDKGLAYGVVFPLLILRMIEDLRYEGIQFSQHSETEWQDVLKLMDLERQTILKRVEYIQGLQTKRLREKHFKSIPEWLASRSAFWNEAFEPIYKGYNLGAVVARKNKGCY